MSTAWLTIARCLMVFALLWGFLGCAQSTMRVKPQPPEAPPAIIQPAPKSAGNIPPARELPPPPSKPETQPYVHKVRYSGENLISIAEWYTGSRKNWAVIAKANPDLNPNRIFIGDTILIPENLMKRRDPLPPDFLINTAHKEPAKQASPLKQPSTESDAIELFNPEITEQPSADSDTIPLFGPIE